MTKKSEKEAKENLAIWEKYEKCKEYVEHKQIKANTERNWNFYLGKQWHDAKDRNGELEKNLVSKNFIKPVVRFKVATIAQHSLTAIFSDIGEDDTDICESLSRLFDISWEKSKMDRVGWKALRDSAVAGDSHVFFHSGDTRVTPQILLNTQIYFGDENIQSVQDQPYIIIEERVGVDKLRAQAKANGVPADDIEMIRPDKESDEQLLNTSEVDNKTTSIIYMDKKDGIVRVARAVKNCVYEPIHPVQQDRNGEYTGRGLTMYPIVSLVWETQPNSTRGVSEVTQLIPNQLELNKTLVRRSISIKQTAYSKLAVDSVAIANPEDLEKVGGIIKLNGGTSQAVDSMIKYLSPASQSPDAKAFSDEILSDTRELAGASDVMMGNYNPARVSGTAITSIKEQQNLPMNEQIEMYKEFVEEVAQLYFDLWVTYNPESIEMGGISVSTEELQNIVPNVRIDISENNSVSRVVEKQSLDNLLTNGIITFEEYVTALPDHADVPKKKLEQIVAERQRVQQEQAMMQQQQSQLMGGDQVSPQPYNENVLEEGEALPETAY